MPTPVLMPALSPTMEEGTIAKWTVKEGDKVSSGDVIAEIETDKATMEVEAVDEGVIGKILIDEGAENVKVNATIAVILSDGESAADIDTSALQSMAAPANDTGAAVPAETGDAQIASAPALEITAAVDPEIPADAASWSISPFETPYAMRWLKRCAAILTCS